MLVCEFRSCFEMLNFLSKSI